jgi:hypothetical protein
MPHSGEQSLIRTPPSIGHRPSNRMKRAERLNVDLNGAVSKLLNMMSQMGLEERKAFCHKLATSKRFRQKLIQDHFSAFLPESG